MRVAIYGGSFNPPHFGHLFIANEVRQILNYDKIIFVPSSVSAHKHNDTNTSDLNRLKMLEIATNELDWALISECDLTRGGVTRSIDTINDIYKEYSLKTKPGFIIGDDLLEGFHLWKQPESIVEKADLIVATRNDNTSNIKYKYTSVKNRVFPLSSSEIRSRVKWGLNIDFLLPKDVIQYIRNHELYKTT